MRPDFKGRQNSNIRKENTYKQILHYSKTRKTQ